MRLAAGAAKPLASQLCGLADAEGRILANDVRSLINLPMADVSAMDGWAVAGDGPWRVDGRVVNGTTRRDPLAAGSAVGIGTGGVVPAGATAIVRREHGSVAGDSLRWTPPEGVGLSLKDVRPCGDEARLGEVMVPVGARLDAMYLALAASVGHDELEVSGVPTVDLLVTGDEVDMSGVPMVGRVRDSVSPALTGMVRGAGATVGRVVAVPDRVEALAARVLASTADVVITTGGTAVGEADHLHEALRLVRAEILVDGIAVRPGAPVDPRDAARRPPGGRTSRQSLRRRRRLPRTRRAGTPRDDTGAPAPRDVRVCSAPTSARSTVARGSCRSPVPKAGWCRPPGRVRRCSAVSPRPTG